MKTKEIKQKTLMLATRVSIEQFEEIKRKAENDKRTVSEYIRVAALESERGK